MVEKAINAEVKTSIQPLFKTKKIDFRYLKDYRLSAKKDKDKAIRKNQNGDKVKSYNPFPTNSKPQT